MTCRILLADSDREWLKKAKNFLEKELYIVDPVTNGKNAQLSLGKNPYFAVILGLGLKNHSSVRVMSYINTHHPDLKVLAMLDKKAKNPEQGIRLLDKLKQFRIDHILAKSNCFQQLKKELEGLETGKTRPIALPSAQKRASSEKEIHCNDDQFSKIKIEDFYTPKTISFDVFIRLKKGRYIKILHAGDQMEEERLERYRKNKKTAWLYFKKEDLDKYVPFQNFLAGKVVGHTSTKPDTQLGIFKNVAEKYQEQSFFEGVNSKVLEQGKQIAFNISKLVEKEEGLTEYLSSCSTRDPGFPSHTFLVTLFATAVVKQFQWHSPKILETIALAGLLHDIGMLQLPERLIGKSTRDMSAEELALYQKHPEYGAKMVGDSAVIPHTVKQIIYQHHEYYDGSGYPEGKRRNEILILANIISLVDDFVHTIVEEDILPAQAVNIFFNEKNHYHPSIISHFLHLFEDEVILKAS